MFNFFGKKVPSEVGLGQVAEPDKPRTKNPDLKTWMGEAGAAGLDGDVGDGELDVSVGDLKNQPAVTVVGHQDRHGLHLVTPEEDGEPIDGDLLGEPAANSEPETAETPDPMEIELTEKLVALKAQKKAIEDAMVAAEATLLAYQTAKDKINRAAA